MKLTRREFNQTLAGGMLALGLSGVASSSSHAKPLVNKDSLMAFTLPDLPYPKNALEPHMSAQTFDFHHGKHHKAYVDKLNELIKGTPLESKSLEEIILETAKDESKKPVFNNAAQTWNHTFFWNSMKPNGGGEPKGKIAEMIQSSFGSLDTFKTKFKEAGVGQFGSGWAWLIVDGGKLDIMKTPNADLPMAHGKKAILTCDVWEHAYYLDYQNRRPDFLGVFLDKLVNWEFAEKNLA